MKKIKKLIWGALFLFLPFFVKAQLSNPTDSSSGGWNPDTLSASGLPEASIYDIISNFMLWILSIFGILAVIGFTISGIMYLVSVGDDDTIKKAKSYMMYCIIGVAVALSGLVIILAVDSFLGGSSNSF